MLSQEKKGYKGVPSFVARVVPFIFAHLTCIFSQRDVGNHGHLKKRFKVRIVRLDCNYLLEYSFKGPFCASF